VYTPITQSYTTHITVAVYNTATLIGKKIVQCQVENSVKERKTA